MNSLSLRYYLIIFIGIFFIGLNGCSGGSAGDDDDDNDTTSNPLAVTYPDDLVISSPTASGTSTSGSLSAVMKFQETPPEFIPERFEDKKEEIHGFINADALEDLAFEVDLRAMVNGPGCFGPPLFLSGNHPNTPEPDDLNPITCNPPGACLPPFDLGLWIEEELWVEGENGEACAAAELNAQIGSIENYIDTSTKSVAAAIGAANINSVEIPAAGESRDLAEIVNEVMETNSMPLEVNTATLTREETNTADGDPVFVTAIEGEITVSLPDGSTSTSILKVNLEHIPQGSIEGGGGLIKAQTIEDDLYCGRMQQVITLTEDTVGGEESMPDGCEEGEEGFAECIAIDYCKESATSLTYHLTRAQFCGLDPTTVNCFDETTGMVARGADWVHNFFDIRANMNPEDFSGTLAQAWQAGFGDGNTRVFNVIVLADGTGTGYFGYGVNIPDGAAEDIGEIKGMICNWAGPGAGPFGNKVMQDLAQKQTMTLNETSGIFESNIVNIQYAPTNDCGKAAGTFSYGITNAASDVAIGIAVEDDLISLEEVDFTVPALPTVP